MKDVIVKVLWSTLGAVFIAVFAQFEIELPLNEAGISISGQTFAILLAAFFLGRWYGLLAVIIYIIMGAIGLPAFSGGSSGIDKLYGGSGGYFGGFLYAAYRVGAYGDVGWRKTFPKCLLAMLFGTLLILLFGVFRLYFSYSDFSKALEVGFYPFIGGGIIKVLLGATVAFVVEKLVAPHRS